MVEEKKEEGEQEKEEESGKQGTQPFWSSGVNYPPTWTMSL